ncbi:MAG TPA: hypothetical protein VK140_11280 [Ktedonobacteraceae bacterium]|nr:hypothetical protein [Ktedonobacteraceae bacterium]
MSQQQMNFDEINRDESASYTAGYEEPPHYNTYSSGSFGQKLSGHESGRTPTAGQRLALAIVSLVLLLLMFFAIVAVALSGSLAPDVAKNLSPVLGLVSLGFIAAIIVVNVVFNRKH